MLVLWLCILILIYFCVDAYAALNNEAFMEVVENVVEMAQDIVETGNGPNSHVLEVVLLFVYFAS